MTLDKSLWPDLQKFWTPKNSFEVSILEIQVLSKFENQAINHLNLVWCNMFILSHLNEIPSSHFFKKFNKLLGFFFFLYLYGLCLVILSHSKYCLEKHPKLGKILAFSDHYLLTKTFILSLYCFFKPMDCAICKNTQDREVHNGVTCVNWVNY